VALSISVEKGNGGLWLRSSVNLELRQRLVPKSPAGFRESVRHPIVPTSNGVPAFTRHVPGCTPGATRTLALAAGIRLDVVNRQLGHSSIAITADVYGHPVDEALTEAAQKMASVLGDGRRSK
jgi:integrase